MENDEAEEDEEEQEEEEEEEEEQTPKTEQVCVFSAVTKDDDFAMRHDALGPATMEITDDVRP